jgi:glycosyltransferase involved in cell wall biosynthesis
MTLLHNVTVCIPVDSVLRKHQKIIINNSVTEIRIYIPGIKNNNTYIRALAELLMPFLVYIMMLKTGTVFKKYEAIIWYSPSIFLSLLVAMIKLKSNCKSYLILRDIFPDWANDLGLIPNKIVNYFFRVIASFQLKVANRIGIQSEGNRNILLNYSSKLNQKIEVLNNWLSEIKISELHGELYDLVKDKRKKVFIYSGNIGVSQNLDLFLSAITQIEDIRSDFVMIVVGRGSEMEYLSKKYNLSNVIYFFDEIESNELNFIYQYCAFGVVCLNMLHETHNIPGKFLSYLRAKLPVVALVNKNNDLIKIINQSEVGIVILQQDILSISYHLLSLLEKDEKYYFYKNNCEKLWKNEYSTKIATNQIMNFFKV